MTTAPQLEFFSLTAVANRITEILKPATAAEFWVKAEISGGRLKNNHFYCDLVEIDGNGQQVAKIRCTIWSSQLNLIRRKFENVGLQLQLVNGTQVGLKCKITFSSLYGLAINVLDADPAFSIGLLELRRRELLLKLEKENLFEPNKRVLVPILPQKIGLITSNDSAASNDFLKTIESSPYGFTVLLADATMQGERTKPDICRAIDALERFSPDLIAIVRGGGSKTDLSHLDNEDIGRKIASSQIPFWTGIGHEIDESVLDFVSNRAFKTPTAVAVEIVGRFDSVEKKLFQASKRINSSWSVALFNSKKSQVRWKTGLHQGTRKILDVTKAELAKQRSALERAVGNKVSTHRQHLIKVNLKFDSSLKNFINERKQRVVRSKQSIRMCAENQVKLRGSMLVGLASQFRRKRYLNCVLVKFQQLANSKQRLVRESERLIGLQQQAILERRSSFQQTRYLSRLDGERKSLLSKSRLLRAADPINNLQKGYSLIYDESDKLITSVSNLRPNDKMLVVMNDGKAKINVEEVSGSE